MIASFLAKLGELCSEKEYQRDIINKVRVPFGPC